MTGNLYMGGNFIAGVGDPTAGDHAATKKYADGKVAKEGNNAVERSWRINHDNKNFIFFHDEGHFSFIIWQSLTCRMRPQLRHTLIRRSPRPAAP